MQKSPKHYFCWWNMAFDLNFDPGCVTIPIVILCAKSILYLVAQTFIGMDFDFSKPVVP